MDILLPILLNTLFVLSLGKSLTISLTSFSHCSCSKTNLSKASKEYGDPDIWDMPDFEADALSKQFNIDPEIIKGWRKEHPYEISQQVLDSMNLLYEESEYQAGRRTGLAKKEKAGTQTKPLVFWFSKYQTQDFEFINLANPGHGSEHYLENIIYLKQKFREEFREE